MTSLFYMWAIAVLVTHVVWTSDHIETDFTENSNKKVAIFALIINRFSFLNIGYLQGASMQVLWIKLSAKHDEILGETTV